MPFKARTSHSHEILTNVRCRLMAAQLIIDRCLVYEEIMCVAPPFPAWANLSCFLLFDFGKSKCKMFILLLLFIISPLVPAIL